MKPATKYRQWAGLILLLIILMALLLFAKIHNLLAGSHMGWPVYTIYLLFSGLVILSAILTLMLYTVDKPGGMNEPVFDHSGAAEASAIEHIEEDQAIRQNLIEGIRQRAVEMAEGVQIGKAGNKPGDVLNRIAKALPLVQGLYYQREAGSETFTVAGEYAFYGESKPAPFQMGVTLPGQVARNRAMLNISNLPENYMSIVSGLGQGAPKSLVILPIVHLDDTVAVIELAFFKALSWQDEELLKAFATALDKNIDLGTQQKLNKKYEG
jgi:hypothetical protein